MSDECVIDVNHENKKSKNQIKKENKKKFWEEHKEEIKNKQKLKKKEKQKEKQKGRLKEKEEENKDRDKETKEIVFDTIEDKPFQQRKRIIEYIDKSKNGLPIIIDCSFDDLMSSKEINSLAKQINFIYSSNKKQSRPFRLVLFNLQTKLNDSLLKQGLLYWKGIDIVKEKELTWIELKNKLNVDQIVYLTGDSENDLYSINDNCNENNFPCAYVIGGIVDRNRHKGLTYNIAVKENLSHGRLPLNDHLQLRSSQILTTNHVFDIISHYYNDKNKSWADAVKSIIPKRKIDE